MAVDADSFKYWVPVDRNEPNNAHAFSLQLIGRDKRVLELGCAAGHVTRALVEAGCSVVGLEYEEEAAAAAREVAEDVVVTDLFDPENLTKAVDGRQFDVVYAGDVLEHLTDPAGVLAAGRRALRPGGFVVISLPNVAHVDVKLALLQGRFQYREFGLLDRTHLRFFTRASILQLLDDAGLELAELRRVVRAPFETELEVDPASVPAHVLDYALQDPEAESYQYVVKAVPNDADGELARAAQRYAELDALLGEERVARRNLELECEDLRGQIQALVDEVHAVQAQVQENQQAKDELAALLGTKTFRATAGLRAAYHRLRGGS